MTTNQNAVFVPATRSSKGIRNQARRMKGRRKSEMIQITSEDS